LNLATDLRDGVRLGKLAEMLGNSSGILEQMRLPAISRLQKVYNVGVSLSALAALEIPNVENIHPNYIVDGHRPQVLKMLWSVMTSFKLDTLLDKTKLKQEIFDIQRSNKSRGLITSSSLCGHVEFCEDVCDLLLVWCQVICACFGYDISNFSTSFANGKALCLLIHYYHPDIIKLCDILPTCVPPVPKDVSTDHVRMLVDNERNNCLLAGEKMMEIGGIPNMFPVSDTYNVPDERATIICIAYLCARLLESSKEIKAAIVIQKAFKRHQQRVYIEQTKLAVSMIEKFWVDHRSRYFDTQSTKYSKPVKIIEAFFMSRRGIFQLLSQERIASVQIQVSLLQK